MLRLLLTTVMLVTSRGSAADGATDGQPFSEAWLQERAQRLAHSAYAPRSAALPNELAQLTFDEYRAIRFRPEAGIWHGSKTLFELQFFHLGHIYREPVSMNIVEGGRAHPVRYGEALFDYGAAHLRQPLADTLGFAGFRIHFPMRRKASLDEVASFLGASYFRAMGRDNAYGVSARGLAIDTAVATGEIFPQFREFYVERPAPGARRLVVHALLDSPPTTGAYRFEISPGVNTNITVTATLYPRLGVERLGMAPLTSMYFHGMNDRAGADDYRPEVHDSDGLLLWFGNGERLWRPVRNPDRLSVSVFRADSLKGFGLLQRERHPDHYQDLKAAYERRPSVWVDPTEGFSRGSVFLIEIPSRDETNDNVVAFFTPDQRLTPGTPLRFSYRLLWGRSPEPPIAIAASVATHTGSARQIGVPDAQQPLPASARKMVVDFAPAPAPGGADGVEAVVTASTGEVRNVRVQAQPNIRGYRAAFDFVPKGTEPAEMRCFLRRGPRALSETWTYRLER